MEGMLSSDRALGLVEPGSARVGVGIDSLNQFLNAIGRYPRLTPAEEVQLSKRIESGDEDARRRMIESNLRLVVAIAQEQRSRSMPFLDLVQEGILGLMRAVDEFDWRLGNRFATYASWWIQLSIRRALADAALTASRTISLDSTPANGGRPLLEQIPDEHADDPSGLRSVVA